MKRRKRGRSGWHQWPYHISDGRTWWQQLPSPPPLPLTSNSLNASCFHFMTCELQGHTKPVHSVCWDPSGDLVASVSEDSVRVWTLGSGSEGECTHELNCMGNKFHSCVFHPTYSSLLVIGCYQSLELWNMAVNKTMALSAHEGLIASLAVSNVNGLVASASHDKLIKLWK